jgi:hypothetical protein
LNLNRSICSALLLWLGVIALPAQQAIRASLASEHAAAQRKKNFDDHYNLDLDPVRLRFSAEAGAEYNDNVNYSTGKPEADVILRPQVGIHAYWQATDRNTLTVDFKLGYEYYTQGARPSRAIVTGDQDSGLFFDVYAGDFVLRLRDTFTLSQDTSEDPTAAGVADVFRFENTLGASLDWDLSDLILQLNYDHDSYVPLDDLYKYLRHEADMVSLRATAFLNPALSAGVELGAGATAYRDASLSDNTHYSYGPFLNYVASDALNLRISFGQVFYEFDPSSFITNSTSQSSFYADLTAEHQFSPRTSQSLSLGQSLSTDLNGAPVRTLYARYGVGLDIIQHWSFRPSIAYEDGTQSLGLTQEDFTRYTAGLTASRLITQKLRGTLGYYYVMKQSNVSAYEYTQNRLVLTLAYQF